MMVLTGMLTLASEIYGTAVLEGFAHWVKEYKREILYYILSLI